MSSDTSHACPHCDEKLLPWRSPDMTTWGGNVQLVCFNDECPYFAKGWEWMKSQFNVNASYRYRLDPVTGDNGPIAVWNRDALKDQITEEPPAPTS